MPRRNAIAAMALLIFCLTPLAAQETNHPEIVVDVKTEELNIQPVAANWPSYNGDYSGQRFSSLDQINQANVSQLRASWVFHSPNSRDMEVTPVVVNGLMLVTAANDVFALDAQTGRTVWHYSRPITEGLIDDAAQHHSRGVGVWKSRIYAETDNAHLFCLDSRSGNLLWDVPYAQGNKNYGATSAPLVVKDKVIVGTSGGDDGVRGFVAAYEAASGKLAWRFWTIPGPGEPGSESWPGELYKHGGGTTWMPGTYDSQLNTLYWGTSNPSPDFDGAVRPGDDLYTDCVLALDPDTGKLKWHYQFTPHDVHDWDSAHVPVQADLKIGGQPHKVIMVANRNGFFYTLDRESGKLLVAKPFIDGSNWAKEIGKDGRPIILDNLGTADKCLPDNHGGTNFQPPTFDPELGLFFVTAHETCATWQGVKPTEPIGLGVRVPTGGQRLVEGHNQFSALR